MTDTQTVQDNCLQENTHSYNMHHQFNIQVDNRMFIFYYKCVSLIVCIFAVKKILLLYNVPGMICIIMKMNVVFSLVSSCPTSGQLLPEGGRGAGRHS